MAHAFTQVDVLLLPTTATLPVRTGQIDGRTAAFDLARWSRDSYGYAPYTEIAAAALLSAGAMTEQREV